MMRATRSVACAVGFALALIVLPATSHAFGLSGFGGKLGYGVPEDHDGTMVVSGHLEFEQPGSQLHLLPSIGYWSTDNLSDVSANMDGYYHFVREGLMTPYLGAGLGIHFLRNDVSDNSETDLGANLFGGVRFPMSTSHLFLEGRYTMSDLSQFAVLGGVTFH